MLAHRKNKDWAAYARQFIDQLQRPEIDRITGTPPTVAIEQRLSRGGRTDRRIERLKRISGWFDKYLKGRKKK